jgi:uncharacterized Rmd1/YagE family protein
MRCISYCFATTLNVEALEKFLKEKKFLCQRFHDALVVQQTKPAAQIFYFSNGTLVSWNLRHREFATYLAYATPFATQTLENPVVEQCCYVLGEQLNIRPQGHFNVEILTLPEDDIETKLALSFAYSQSNKLTSYQRMIEVLINRYSPTVQQLSQSGHITLSHSDIKKIIGKILSAKSLVNLSSSYTYMPKFFWQYPNLEQEYVMLARYLDITKRVDGLNQQLDTLSEVFTMLNSYLQNRHANLLEVIIIGLIGVEIVLSFWKILF